MINEAFILLSVGNAAGVGSRIRLGVAFEWGFAALGKVC
jgi:hypothetical protein